jgi:hypothetical protein
MRKKHWLLFVSLSFIVQTVFISHAFAADITRKFSVTPSISIREEYNDNIFLTSSDEESDFITTINPSINFAYRTRIITLSLDYGLNFEFYADNSDLNDTSLSETQEINLNTTLSLYKDIFFVSITDVYTRVSIDERKQVAFDNHFVNLTDSNTFTINPYIEYPLAPTVRATAGYRYTNRWYREDEANDSENHSVYLDITKEFTPNLNASLSYNYYDHLTDGDEIEDQDRTRHSAHVGINYQPTPRLSLSGSIGHTWVDYDEFSDDNFPDWNVNANYLLTELISLSASYSQSYYDSVNEGPIVAETISGTVSYSGKIPINITVHNTESDYELSDRKDKSTGVTVSTSMPITPQMTGSLSGSYTKYKYDSTSLAIVVNPLFPGVIFLVPIPEEEDFDRYSASISFAYDLNITTVTLGYTYNQTDSDIAENDFKNNIVWIQARFSI